MFRSSDVTGVLLKKYRVTISDVIYTLSEKKHATLHSFITLTNVTDFHNSFTARISKKFQTKVVLFSTTR